MKRNELLIIVLICIGLTFIFSSCNGSDKEEESAANNPPTCIITSPQNNAEFLSSEDITIAVAAEDADGTIAEVKLYVRNSEHSSKSTPPYNFTLYANEILGDNITIKAVATDNKGATTEASIRITVVLAAIGVSYRGGKIAYFDHTGKHGLIVAPTDQSSIQGNVVRWNNGSDIVTGAIGTAIGTGKSNTEAIVAAQGNGSYAAQICHDLVLNGYDDWFLQAYTN